MGPNEAIGSNHVEPLARAFAYANGLMRNYWHQQLHMPMGPRKAIGNSSCKCQ